MRFCGLPCCGDGRILRWSLSTRAFAQTNGGADGWALQMAKLESDAAVAALIAVAGAAPTIVRNQFLRGVVRARYHISRSSL